MKSVVLYEKKERVAYITMNRPEALNALNAELVSELNKAWRTFNQDEEALVAVLSGAGRAFSSGADFKAIASGWVDDLAPALPGIGTEDIWKPIIAAVHSHCIGAGYRRGLARHYLLRKGLAGRRNLSPSGQ